MSSRSCDFLLIGPVFRGCLEAQSFPTDPNGLSQPYFWAHPTPQLDAPGR